MIYNYFPSSERRRELSLVVVSRVVSSVQAWASQSVVGLWRYNTIEWLGLRCGTQNGHTVQVDESFYLLNNSTTHRAEQQQTAGKRRRGWRRCWRIDELDMRRKRGAAKWTELYSEPASKAATAAADLRTGSCPKRERIVTTGRWKQKVEFKRPTIAMWWCYQTVYHSDMISRECDIYWLEATNKWIRL